MGHLNGILARVGGNLNNNFQKSQMPGGGGMLKLRFDRSSTSYETTHCGICLTSNKNLHWASGGDVWTKNYIFWNNFLLENWSFVR